MDRQTIPTVFVCLFFNERFKILKNLSFSESVYLSVYLYMNNFNIKLLIVVICIVCVDADYQLFVFLNFLFFFRKILFGGVK